MDNKQQVQVKEQRPIDLMKSFINAPSVQEQFKNALGNHRDAFVASLIDLYTGDKQLQTCKPADVIKEALRAATMQLPLNKALGFAYIVVFNNTVKRPDGQWEKVPTPTFVPGYKGYIQLAMRTGQYKNINADFVYDGELRTVSKLTGEIALDGEKKSDKIVGYFCHFELLNGFAKTLYMSVGDMADYALRYSPSFSGKNKPTRDFLIAAAQKNEPSKQVGWNGNFNDMALKTVIRRLLSKYGYLSIEMQNALAGDLEDAQADRNDLIAENANKKVIDLDGTQYEEVNEETGEVVEKKDGDENPKPEQEAPQAEAPNPGY